MAQSPVQTLRGSTSTDACTQTSPVSSTPSSVPLMATLAPRPTRSLPPPPPVPTQTRRPLHGVSPAPGPITYPPPPFSYQPLPSTFSSDRREPKPPAEPSVSYSNLRHPPTEPTKRRVLLGSPPGLRRSLLGSPPPQRRSLLGSPPTLPRIPGSPQSLSVYFCNLHGRPQKLMKKHHSYSETKLKNYLPKNKNINKKSGDIKKNPVPTTTKTVISEIISDIIRDTVAPTDNNLSKDDSVCSLDTSSITGVLGDPTAEISSDTPKHLN